MIMFDLSLCVLQDPVSMMLLYPGDAIAFIAMDRAAIL
jgi:hypothetical protein